MKNIKALSLLGLAVVFGLGAAFYATRWMASRSEGQTSQIVVAAVDIELGSRINPQMLTTVAWPTSAVPSGSFTDIKNLSERVVKVTIPRGDAVLDRKLAPAGTQGGLSAVISEGKRAMTVRVNDVIGVAGFALPGNFVDVMVNTQKQEKSGKDSQISLTVLEQVLVLAVAQEASRDDLKPKVVSAVTLELTPQDAEKLDLARSVGTLSLVLRNQLDKENVATQGVTREQLLDMKTAAVVRLMEVAPPAAGRSATKPRGPSPVRSPALVAAMPPRECVEVIANGTRTQSCF